MFTLEGDLKRELNLTKQGKMTVVVFIDGDEMLQLGKNRVALSQHFRYF